MGGEGGGEREREKGGGGEKDGERGGGGVGWTGEGRWGIAGERDGRISRIGVEGWLGESGRTKCKSVRRQ